MKGFVKAGFAAALGLAVAVAPAQAQKTPIKWDAGVGLSFASTSGYGTGFNLRFGANFTPKGWPVWIRPEANFDHYSFNCGGLCSGAGVNLIGVTGDVGYDFKSSSTLKPYVLAGLGIINFHPTGCGGFCGSSTNLGINLGGGVRMPVGKMTGFAELKYSDVNSFGSFPLTVGLMF